MRTQILSLLVGLICLLNPHVTTAQSQDPEEADSTKAASRFQQGVELYREGSYEGALAEFRKAYQISPSYRVLYNIAQAQHALHDFVGAYRSLLQYVSEGGGDITADRRTQVDEMSAKLRERIAHLEISTNMTGVDVRVDDVSVGVSPLPGPIAVNVGTHKVSAFKAGSPEAIRNLTVAGRENVRVELHVDEPVVASTRLTPSGASAPAGTLSGKTPASAESGRTGLIVSLSTTAAFAVGTGVFGYFALGAQKDLKNQLNTYPNTTAKIEDARTKSKNYGYITDAFGAATVISGGLALYFALSHGGDSAAAKPPKTGKTLVLVPTLRGMAMQGSF